MNDHQNSDRKKAALAELLTKVPKLPSTPAIGDYVLATKYNDGDPQDQWCVGFYAGLTNADKYDPPRYDVVNDKGSQFRGNGFRRISKITPERGAWMLERARDIELSGKSVWYFARCPMDNPPTTETEGALPGSGGWYWWRESPTKKWQPIKVDPPENGWAPSVYRASHTVEVQDMPGEWGPEIIPPNA